jgi:glycine cleavage system H protein
MNETFQVAGYELRADRLYDPESNLWIALREPAAARIGFDPLGAETAGDIVAISFAPRGSWLARGEVLASIEAAKFVGPVRSPLSGRVVNHNSALAERPDAINADPFGSWLVELGEIEPAQLGALLAGRERVAAWFEQALQRFRREGALAE